MRNIKLTIEYDGSGYHGWQSQINAITVQDTIEKALENLTGSECNLMGSGRTDVGVHALGQVANFLTNCSIPGEKVSYAINRLLPKDIVVISSKEVSLDFHSRYNAKAKKYSYHIYNSPSPTALLRDRAWHIPQPIDITLIEKALPFLKGTHDFSAFRATGSSVKSSIRTIMDISLSKNQDIIKLDILGDGFLYNMVRIIAGTLVSVGKGKIDADSIPHILQSQDRTKAGITAPARGLYLVEVFY